MEVKTVVIDRTFCGVLTEIGDKYISVGVNGFIVVHIKKIKRTDVRYFFERYFVEYGKVMVAGTIPFGVHANVRESITDYLDRVFKMIHGPWKSTIEEIGQGSFNVIYGKIIWTKTENIENDVKKYIEELQ